MVGDKPETLCGTQGQWEIATRGCQPRAKRSQLWSATGTIHHARGNSSLHTIRVEKTPRSITTLRSAVGLTQKTLSRLDRIRQTRRNESQAPEGSNPPSECRPTAWAEIVTAK